ncbi:MAG TPA: 30S ribosomal protein S10 [bacterium]|nr:30S ribosomal protein S10 [bacterium]HOL35949.1 30S ribosomal protein S10 [bacterium]HPP09222.1 30S ribosomal protein S10 [bacterium]
MDKKRIRIKLRSFDHRVLDESVKQIMDIAKSTGVQIVGPIPLPTKKEIYTVLRSPHVNKKSREQFQLCTHKRLIDILEPTTRTVDALSRLNLPSGVEVEMKLE